MPITLEQLAEHVAKVADRVGSRSFVDVNAIADSIRAALAEQPVDPPTDWKARAEAAEVECYKLEQEGQMWEQENQALRRQRDAALSEVARLETKLQQAMGYAKCAEACEDYEGPVRWRWKDMAELLEGDAHSDVPEVRK